MKKICLIAIYLLSALTFLTTSCQHDDDTYVGPPICPTENFAIKHGFNIVPSVDLSSTIMGIGAAFTEKVSWKVTLTGQESGAVKEYSDYSDTIMIRWSGQAGGNTFFTDEEVKVVLTIPCKDPITRTVTISANDFATSNDMYLLLNDFEGNGEASTGWFFYANPSISKGVVSGPLTPLQGSSYATTKSTAAGWFAGGFGATIPSGALSSISSIDPEKVYINAFVNSNGNKQTLLGITFVAGGQNYTATINQDWEGWKLVSFKLSEFKNSGVSLSSINDITGIEFGLNALTPNAVCETNVDFIIFTIDKPYNQF